MLATRLFIVSKVEKTLEFHFHERANLRLYINVSALFTVQPAILNATSGVPRGGVWGVQTPPPEIPKISVESSIAKARSTGVSISFYSSLCSNTVLIY